MPLGGPLLALALLAEAPLWCVAFEPAPAPAPELQRPTIQRPRGEADDQKRVETAPTSDLSAVQTLDGRTLAPNAGPSASETRQSEAKIGIDLEGRVLDDVFDRPLGGTRVNIRGGPDDQVALSVDTNGDGRFAFDQLPPGDYVVTVFGPAGANQERITLEPGKRPRPLFMSGPYRRAPAKDESGRLNYPGLAANPTIRSYQVPLSLAGIFGVLTLATLTGGLVELETGDCHPSDPTCFEPARYRRTGKILLGVSAVSAVVGGVNLGVGIKRRRSYLGVALKTLSPAGLRF